VAPHLRRRLVAFMKEVGESFPTWGDLFVHVELFAVFQEIGKGNWWFLYSFWIRGISWKETPEIFMVFDKFLLWLFHGVWKVQSDFFIVFDQWK